MPLILPSGQIFDRGLTLDPAYKQDYAGPNGDFSGEVGLVLGAGDPEMDLIANLAYGLEIPYVYARVYGKNGHSEKLRRVSPAITEAYSANWDDRISRVGEVITIECAIQGFSPQKMIDHHAPRGPQGLDHTPDDIDMSWRNAVRASSVGQMVTEFGVEFSPTTMIIGALDHAGPKLLHYGLDGIDGLDDIQKDDARAVMVHEIVRGGDRNEAEPSENSMREVNEGIDLFREFAANPPSERVLNLGRVSVVDLRDHVLPPGYSEGALMIKTAFAIERKVALVAVEDAREGHPRRQMLSGMVEIEHIDGFIDVIVTGQGLERPFVDTRRGIAMAYEPGSE